MNEVFLVQPRMGKAARLAGISLISLLQGFGLGAGLIIAIGAQNAFVLRQGLKWTVAASLIWTALR